MLVWPRVADPDLDPDAEAFVDDEPAADPWYMSFLFFTWGVARVVPLESF